MPFLACQLNTYTCSWQGSPGVLMNPLSAYHGLTSSPITTVGSLPPQHTGNPWHILAPDLLLCYIIISTLFYNIFVVMLFNFNHFSMESQLHCSMESYGSIFLCSCKVLLFYENIVLIFFNGVIQFYCLWK